MQRLHTAQCLDLMGLRICKVKIKGQSEHTAQTSSALIITSCQSQRVYQAGAAEYAQIQAARLCQLHDRLEEGNQTIKQRLQKKDQRHGKKKKMNEQLRN